VANKPRGSGDPGAIMTEEEAKSAAKSRDDLQIKDYGKEELLLSPVPKISL